MIPSPLPPTTHFYRHHWDEEDLRLSPLEWLVLCGIASLGWGAYWLVLHWVDHFLGDWLIWYVELLSPLCALPFLWLFNRYGHNPLHWWPMLWGHSVKLDDHNADLVLMDQQAVVKVMGGPMRVWCDIRDKGDVYLKFRRRRDAVWFGLFPYFRSRGSRKKKI